MLPQYLSGEQQCLIPGSMAVDIVDGFEVVQIQHEESACTAGAGGEEFIHPQGCGALIEQSGQRIQTGAH